MKTETLEDVAAVRAGSLGALASVSLEALSRHHAPLLVARRLQAIAGRRLQLLPAAVQDLTRAVLAFVERRVRAQAGS